MLKFNVLENKVVAPKKKIPFKEKFKIFLSDVIMEKKITDLDSGLKQALKTIDKITKLTNGNSSEFSKQVEFKVFLAYINKIDSILCDNGFTAYGGLVEDTSNIRTLLYEVTKRWGNGGYETASLMLQEKIKPILESWQADVRVYMAELHLARNSKYKQ